MSRPILLRGEGLSKSYAARGSRGTQLLRLLVGRRAAAGAAPAVDDVSLELAPGECLGIVGRNGAGKSTLLRMLCGITDPDAGHIDRVGRIAPMLELGAGFRPDFTGRENVLINAALYGMDRQEAVDRLDRICAFSGIGRYFDRPVREYSTGMRARLAFSVAAHVDADVLVVDELLGVGDAQFQQQCRRFIRAFLERGSVILVSHDDTLLLSSCTRVAWMDEGRIVASGDPAGTLLRYRAFMSGSPTEGEVNSIRPAEEGSTERDLAYGTNRIRISPFRSDAPSHGLGAVRIDDVRFESAGRPAFEIEGSDNVELVIAGKALESADSLIAGFILRDEAGQNLFGDNSFETYRLSPRNLVAGQRFEARFRFTMPYLPRGIHLLAPSIIAGTQADHVHQCWIEEAVVLEVSASPVAFGKIGVTYGGAITTRHAPG